MNNARAEIHSRLEKEEWDLLIIGGGITGAGILREAVNRGLKAILVEQRDFAWGTSSRSGQLVHGGLRYLEQGNFRLTFESVRERGKLLRELPGLVDECGMMMTFYGKNRLKWLIVRAALLVYDIMNGSLRKHGFPAADVSRLAPGIKNKDLTGGLQFHESVTDDARLVLRVLQEARDEGGSAVNYCRVVSLILDNERVCGATLKDGINGREMNLQAKQVINSTGAWADYLRQGIHRQNRNRIRPLQGSHLVFSADRLPVKQNIVITHPTSKRPGFVMPWEGRVITGNTDIDHQLDPEREVSISAEEIDYLLENIRHHFPDLDICEKDIIGTFSGARPVVDSGKKEPSAESRDHVVWQENGLITVTGGKLTTFRLIARDALKAASSALGRFKEASGQNPYFTTMPDIASIKGAVDEDVLYRLSGRFGSRAKELINAAQKGELERIPGTMTVWAELRWAAEHELVEHLEDLMLRRTRLGLLLENGGKTYLPKIRKICQPLLGWTDDRWDQEEKDYLAKRNRCHGVPMDQSS